MENSDRLSMRHIEGVLILSITSTNRGANGLIFECDEMRLCYGYCTIFGIEDTVPELIEPIISSCLVQNPIKLRLYDERREKPFET